MYVPLQQQYTSTLKILARTTSGRRVARELQSILATMDPRLPILHASALDEEGGPVVTQLRIAAATAGSLGLVGLLLACVGIYGLTMYVMAQRTREIGIRVALGAEPGDLLRMVLREGMRLVAAGCAIGLLLGAATSRLLVTLLFGVPPLDPVTFGGAAALFAVVGLAACYVPVRHALAINPTEALRYE